MIYNSTQSSYSFRFPQVCVSSLFRATNLATRNPATPKKSNASWPTAKSSSICSTKLTLMAAMPIPCTSIWRKSKVEPSSTPSSGTSPSLLSTRTASPSNASRQQHLPRKCWRMSRNTSTPRASCKENIPSQVIQCLALSSFHAEISYLHKTRKIRPGLAKEIKHPASATQAERLIKSHKARGRWWRIVWRRMIIKQIFPQSLLSYGSVWWDVDALL